MANGSGPTTNIDVSSSVAQNAAPITPTTVTPSASPGYVHGITVLCQSGAASNNSAITNQVEDSVFVCTIPAGAMGTNGAVRITIAWLNHDSFIKPEDVVRARKATCEGVGPLV